MSVIGRLVKVTYSCGLYEIRTGEEVYEHFIKGIKNGIAYNGCKYIQELRNWEADGNWSE